MMRPWPWGDGVKVVHYHSIGLMAVEKPVNMPVHPNDRRVDRRALLQLPYDYGLEAYLGESGVKLFLCNRLDAPTSGLVLLAETLKVAESVRACFRNHEVEKGYDAWVKGRLRHSKEIWKDQLVIKKGKTYVRTGRGVGGVEAVTRVELKSSVVVAGVTCSLLKMRPLTGRTHQLRVQSMARRLPIIGDRSYGDFTYNRVFQQKTGVRRLMLHCSSNRLRVETDGSEAIDFTAESELPEAFLLGKPAK